VLPRLLPQYLIYLASRHKVGFGCPVRPPVRCLCEERRALNVTILRWNGAFNGPIPVLTNEILLLVLEELSLTVCNCNPAAEQLLERGLFPCSPIRPSVAADINLLELIITSFLHLSLNVTGWADLWGII
jgi:hypothetical protein